MSRVASHLHPFPIVIALGGNLGDRRETIERSCALLERGGVRVLCRSRLYWTRPWGVAEQPPFLNAAIAVRTSLRPLELLWRCRAVEAELGRRRALHWGPRRIDLDLLVYGSLALQHPELTLPHPMIPRRDFVLAPLIDLAIPPSPAFSSCPWGSLLHALPPEDRTITWSAPWD